MESPGSPSSPSSSSSSSSASSTSPSSSPFSSAATGTEALSTFSTLYDSLDLGWELVHDTTTEEGKQTFVNKLEALLRASSTIPKAEASKLCLALAYFLSDSQVRTLPSLCHDVCRCFTLLADKVEKAEDGALGETLYALFATPEHHAVMTIAIQVIISQLPSLSSAFGIFFVDSLVPPLLDSFSKENAKGAVAILKQFLNYCPRILNAHRKNISFLGTDYLNTGERVGKGQFGTVYLGRNITTGDKVAIKVINWKELTADKGEAGREKAKKQLTNEIAIMKQATHPNTVCLFDIVQQKSCINLIMEYVGGGDMGQYLKKKGTLTEEETRHWLQQLAAGLEFMRNKNILHRDLKPDNLLLSSADPTGMLKIADFGLGRFLQPGELAGTHVGTPLYMAPEIFQPKPYSDKADLWSVGVIVYQMLVGRLPYTGSDRRELVTNLATKPLEFPTNLRISPEMKDLLQSLLQRNSDLRISWAEFFLHPCVVPPPPTEEDDFTSSRMGPSHSIMLEEYKKELNEKMAEIQKLKTQLKALEEAKDEEKRKLNEEKEELIKLRHDLEQSIESLKRINETERRRVEELDKAKHQLEKELDEERTKLVFALQQQQSEKQKEEEDSALLRKEVESLKAQLEELKSKNETAEQQLAKKEQELIKLRQKKQKGKKKQKTKSQPQTAKEKVKATEQMNRKQQGVQLSSLDFTLRIPMTNTMSIFHGQRHMTNMEDTKTSKYLCEVFMLEFSTAECVGNFVRVHFDARGDGSVGPLQNPNYSRLIALDAFGREIASTRPHPIVRDDLPGSCQPLEFGENLLFSADSPRPFSFDCCPEAAASLMSLASSAEQEEEFSLFLLRSHFIVKTNSRIVGYLDFFAPSSFLSETSYFFCYGKAGYSPVKLFEL